MSHKHPIYDTDPHFTIDPITRKITNHTAGKTRLMQYDHNSERFTFDIPRLVDGHDMSLCDKVEIHYTNISKNNAQHNDGVYPVSDITTNAETDKVYFSWLISQNATQIVGTLNFIIKFICLDGEDVTYRWNTDILKDILISDGINNAESVIADNSDVLEAWKAEVLADVAQSVAAAEESAKAAGASALSAESSVRSASNLLMSATQAVGRASEEADRAEAAAERAEEASPEIVQTTGDSETAVMSQKAVTNIVEELAEYVDNTYSPSMPDTCPFKGAVKATGNFELSNSWLCTDYIYVNKTTTIKSKNSIYGNNTIPTVAFYDINKNFISSITIASTGYHYIDAVPPENARYARLTFLASQTAGEIYVKGWKNDVPVDFVMQIPGSSEKNVISQKAVTDIAERVGGINFFNGVCTVGWIDYDGNYADSESGNYYVSDFFPVKKDRYYYDISGGYESTLGYGAGTLCFYDKNKTPIIRNQYTKAVTDDISNATIYTDKFKAPEDGFVRYQFHKARLKLDKICFFESDKVITKMSEMPEHFFSLQVRLSTIENDVKEIKGIEALKRNENALCNLNAAARYNAFASKHFTALITTDVHGDAERFKNAIDILNNADAIDCGFCLGDIQGGDFSENDGSWYTNIVNTSEKPFYTVLGNHDQANYSKPMTGGTPTEAFNKFIQPTLGVLGQDIATPYYKVQNDTYKIVMICLNNYDAPVVKNAGETFVIHRGAECISTQQLAWFIDTLNDILPDYHLIIVRHSFPSENQRIDNEWSQTGKLDGGGLVYEDNNIIPDIVNAWINGTSLSKTYAPKSGFEICPTHNVDVDFTARGEGDFICYLIGHTHKDLICKSSIYENQIMLGFCPTTIDKANNQWIDLPRVEGARSEDAITAVTVDTTARKIRLVRFGSDITFDLIKRDVTTVDY